MLVGDSTGSVLAGLARRETSSLHVQQMVFYRQQRERFLCEIGRTGKGEKSMCCWSDSILNQRLPCPLSENLNG